jgi:hypothetical protein
VDALVVLAVAVEDCVDEAAAEPVELDDELLPHAANATTATAEPRSASPRVAENPALNALIIETSASVRLESVNTGSELLLATYIRERRSWGRRTGNPRLRRRLR